MPLKLILTGWGTWRWQWCSDRRATPFSGYHARFSTRDWLAQAKGLSRKQREALEAQYLATDEPLRLDGLPTGEAQSHRAPA